MHRMLMIGGIPRDHSFFVPLREFVPDLPRRRDRPRPSTP